MGKLSRAILPALAVFVIIAGSYSYLSYSSQRKLQLQDMHIKAERLFEHLSQDLSHLADHLTIMGNLWFSYSPSEHGPRLFELVAQPTIDLFPSFRFLELRDLNLNTLYSIPSDIVSNHAENNSILETVKQTKRAILSPAMWNPSEEHHCVYMWLPLFDGPELQGFIGGCLDLNYLIANDAAMIGLSGSNVVLQMGDHILFSSGEIKKFPVTITQEQEIMGMPFTVDVRGNLEIPSFLLQVFGLALSLTLSILTYRLILENTKTKQAETKYRQLFELSPLPLMEADFSEIKQYLDELKLKAANDLDALLLEQPEILCKLKILIKITDVNQATLKLYKTDSKQDFLANYHSIFMGEPYDDLSELFNAVAAGGNEFFIETNHMTFTGEKISVHLRWLVVPGYENTFSRVLVSIVDFTEYKIMEKRQELAVNVLTALNSNKDIMSIISDIFTLIKENTGVEALGLRLREGDDFPYFQTSGLPESFVELERSLCQRDKNGNLIRDDKYNPILNCMCGNILSGRIDTSLPFFTAHGSFWTNCTTELLALSSEQVIKYRTRNRCNAEGFESVALIPLRHANETVGLLQLNDRRKGFFNLGMIEFFEGISTSIGTALAKRKAEKALQESEELNRSIVAAIPDTLLRFDHHGRYLDIMAADKYKYHFSNLFLKGKSVFEVLPEDLANRIMTCIKLALKSGKLQTLEYTQDDPGGGTAEFEARFKASGTGEVIAFVRDITELRNYERQLKHASVHDQLTGLYNRAYFEERLTSNYKDFEYPITIISMDLDGLKLINDTFGHDKGDEIILTCADILKQSLHESAILARIGGDEFAALLLRTDETEGEKICNRIREKIDCYNRLHSDLPVSLSLGVACAANKKKPLAELFKQAGHLMYRDKLSHGSGTRSSIVKSLLAALAERDFITGGHARRLTVYCQAVGEKVGLTSQQLSDLSLLSQVHDLGKVGIPDQILLKEGPLTDEEMKVMHRHPEKGYRIALSSDELSTIADLILKHHERWDGKGYPCGLKRQEIPLECRILAIVDAYDAMTNERPYNKVRSKEEAIAELKRCAGSQFDPHLVDVFITVLSENDP